MKTNEVWDLVESKMIELRILTDANWKNSEYKLAALGERVLRTAEQSRMESQILQDGAEELQRSIENLQCKYRFMSNHADEIQVTRIPSENEQST
jgi:hypothetical protein